MAPVYEPDKLPKTKSWIQKLSASEAVEQCILLGLVPDKLLEVNRGLITLYHREHVNPVEPTAHDESADQQSDEGVKPQIQHQGIPQVTPIGSVTTPTSESNTPNLYPTLSHIQEGEEHKHAGSVPSTSTLTGSIPTPQTPLTAQTNTAPPPSCMVMTPSPEWAQIITTATQELGRQMAQAIASMVPVQTPAATPAPQSNHTFAAVRDLIATIPLTSGEEPRLMVEFILATIRLAETKLVDQANLPVLLLPRTTGRLRTLWVQSLSLAAPWPTFLKSVTNRCLPPRILNPITYQMLYEPQGPHQPLSDYLTDLNALVEYFYPHMEPTEVLQLALSGLNFHTRIMMAPYPTPMSVQQLMDMVPVIIEGQRPRVSQSNPPAQGQDHSGQNTSRDNYYRSNRNNNYRGQGNQNPSNTNPPATPPANQGNPSGGSH